MSGRGDWKQLERLGETSGLLLRITKAGHRHLVDPDSGEVVAGQSLSANHSDLDKHRRAILRWIERNKIPGGSLQGAIEGEAMLQDKTGLGQSEAAAIVARVIPARTFAMPEVVAGIQYHLQERHVTQREVAHLAQISTASVSRAFRGEPLIEGVWNALMRAVDVLDTRYPKPVVRTEIKPEVITEEKPPMKVEVFKEVETVPVEAAVPSAVEQKLLTIHLPQDMGVVGRLLQEVSSLVPNAKVIGRDQGMEVWYIPG